MPDDVKNPEVSEGSQRWGARSGARLREARQAKGWAKQRQLAEACGIDTINVSRHETGRNEPSQANIDAYCRALGVTEQWLRFGDDAGAPNPHAELIESYLASKWGAKVSPEVAQQLRATRFAALGIRIVTEEAIHDVRLLLDRYLPAR